MSPFSLCVLFALLAPVRLVLVVHLCTVCMYSSFVSYSHRAKQMCPIYIHKTGDEPRKQDTQASKGSPLLSEEVPYQITLIGLSQGSLDRRREKSIWEMFTENDCNTFADLKGKS